MKKKIYSLMMAASVMLTATLTSCDSDANILQSDQTVGVYSGDVEIELIALEDGVEYLGHYYTRGETLDKFEYRQVDKDTCFAYIEMTNEGNSNMMLVVPIPENRSEAAYFLSVTDIPVSELGNRVASVGVTDIPFGGKKIHANTLFQSYKNAEFDFVDGEDVQKTTVGGEVAFISGNYQLVSEVTITHDANSSLAGIGYDISFSGWLSSGKDSNDLIRRRHKR